MSFYWRRNKNTKAVRMDRVRGAGRVDQFDPGRNRSEPLGIRRDLPEHLLLVHHHHIRKKDRKKESRFLVFCLFFFYAPCARPSLGFRSTDSARHLQFVSHLLGPAESEAPPRHDAAAGHQSATRSSGIQRDQNYHDAHCRRGNVPRLPVGKVKTCGRRPSPLKLKSKLRYYV